MVQPFYGYGGTSSSPWQRGFSPDAVRIADLLRSSDNLPGLETPAPAPLDWAKSVVRQQRGIITGPHSAQTPQWAAQQSQVQDASSFAAQSHAMQSQTGVDQLAERVSVLVAGLQQNVESQFDADKRESESQLNALDAKIDSRFRSLEVRLADAEEQRLGGKSTQDSLREEMQGNIDRSIRRAQENWEARCNELEGKHREVAAKLNEVSEVSQRNTLRLRQVEHQMEEFQRENSTAISKLQEDIAGLHAREPPPWFEDLEESIAALERRSAERQRSLEAQNARRGAELEDFALRENEQREVLRRAFEARLEQELESRLRGVSDNLGGQREEIRRRLEDFEVRISQMRVKMDTHESRIGALGDRAEAACQAALESVRQSIEQQREQIFNEVECQFGMLSKRIEAMGELCEELSIRELRTQGGFRGKPEQMPRTALHTQQGGNLDKRQHLGGRGGHDVHVRPPDMHFESDHG